MALRPQRRAGAFPAGRPGLLLARACSARMQCFVAAHRTRSGCSACSARSIGFPTRPAN